MLLTMSAKSEVFSLAGHTHPAHDATVAPDRDVAAGGLGAADAQCARHMTYPFPIRPYGTPPRRRLSSSIAPDGDLAAEPGDARRARQAHPETRYKRRDR